MADPAYPEAESSDPSYIDYELFLSPTFSAPSFANTLVLSTNNASDTPLDLSTPLSRVLFDIQEVDSHIHTLTSSSALPLLFHTKTQVEASQRISYELAANLKTLNESYQRLKKEVIERHAAAEEIRLVSSRLWETVRLGRSVSRALQLGRQLEVQMGEATLRAPSVPVPNASQSAARDDHRALVRAASTILSLRALLIAAGPGEEGEGLHQVTTITALQRELINPAERSLNARAQQGLKDFALSTVAGGGAGTYAQAEDVKARTASALTTLYLLSPQSAGGKLKSGWEPEWLISAVQDYMRSALSSSATAIGRAMSNLPTLDRALLDVAARCQNIVALGQLLETTPTPSISSSESDDAALPVSTPTAPAPKHHITLLPYVLAALETSTLVSFFWRSLASTLSPKVNELVQKGGPAARALRTHRAEVREMIRDAVAMGCAGVGGKAGNPKAQNEFEREVAVMVGAVVGGFR